MKILGVRRYCIIMRNSIQPREYSKGSGIDGALYATDSNGNPNVLNANRNDDGQWVNTYWDNPDNQWNDNGAFVFPLSESLFISLLLARESFVLPSLQAFSQSLP